MFHKRTEIQEHVPREIREIREIRENQRRRYEKSLSVENLPFAKGALLIATCRLDCQITE